MKNIHPPATAICTDCGEEYGYPGGIATMCACDEVCEVCTCYRRDCRCKEIRTTKEA